ncbi:DUF1467 family protein [Sphingomonas flavalba]|uniref:DUF1467 family protein n=1 Tax=Sphingomonas flavalba TaxID=2559804 RepID=UPI00109DBBCF|nr:DUF1467 family protein [Sphingomonas flavalba]
MNLYSIVAIWSLFWVLCAFLVMPFSEKTDEEAGAEKIPGQADSAPHNFRPGRIILRTTILSSLLFGLFYLNYVNGWVGTEDINLFKYDRAAAAHGD